MFHDFTQTARESYWSDNVITIQTSLARTAADGIEAKIHGSKQKQKIQRPNKGQYRTRSKVRAHYQVM